MRLPKAFNILFTALALSFCLVPATRAQAQQQAKPAKKSAHKARASAPKEAPDANAATPNPAVVKWPSAILSSPWSTNTNPAAARRCLQAKLVW